MKVASSEDSETDQPLSSCQNEKLTYLGQEIRSTQAAHAIRIVPPLFLVERAILAPDRDPMASLGQVDP